MRKTQELYYLIGEGLLGSRIKEILLGRLNIAEKGKHSLSNLGRLCPLER